LDENYQWFLDELVEKNIKIKEKFSPIQENELLPA
jgi:hypothetical protein